MNAADMNGLLLGAVGGGLNAAGDRLAERIANIRGRRTEEKNSEMWEKYCTELAIEVDSLRALVIQKDQVISQKDALLSRLNKHVRELETDVAHYTVRSEGHADYISLLSLRLNKVEDILQRQSAHSFALEEICEFTIKELESLKDPTASLALDPATRKVLYEEQWAKFMATTTVKKGLPRAGIDLN